MNLTIFAVFSHKPCLFSCQDTNRIWNACQRSARNGLVVHNLGTVHIVASISNEIWASTLFFTTWSSHSCGAVRLCGARCGRGLLRTVCGGFIRWIHKVPLSVKAANLARFFPPWTVTREQWADMMMPSISGVAIDMLLFSHIGSPLCHRYRIISRTGYVAFRGTY